MKTRHFFLIAALAPMLLLAMAMSGQAQTVLPWERNTAPPPLSENRTYQDPGENYDPSRHGTAQQSADGQGYSGTRRNGGYDSGYDALRNNQGAQQGYGNARPPVDRGYEAPPRQYREPPRRAQPDYNQGNRGQTYSRQTYPRQDNSGRNAPRQYNRDNRGQYNQGQYDQGQGYPQQGYQPPETGGPGQAYAPPSRDGGYDRDDRYDRRPAPARRNDDTYSDDEILRAGHKFFGKVTKGLAKVIAHVFKKSGRPNAYILGEEGGGALIAGLRYGEGILHTKSGERRRIYWQGPSIGYDFGAEGAKTMILVYNLNDINKMYGRFAGVDGSAYLVGGIGVTFQKRGRVVLAPIRSGLGVRLGANVGYLKYTRRPTWNPF